MTLMSTLDKDTMKKENNWPISFLNIEVKILRKILAIKPSKIWKEPIYHDPIEFTSGVKDGLTFGNTRGESYHYSNEYGNIVYIIIYT